MSAIDAARAGRWRGIVVGSLVALLLAGASPQAIQSGRVDLPAGTVDAATLHLSPDTTLIGQGRGVTFITGTLTFTGTERPSYLEADHGPRIEGVTFTGPGTCLRFVGLTYFSVEHAEFRGCEVGIDFAGSLQGRVDDVLFVSNRTGIRLHAEPIAYFGGTLPPSRVLVSWSAFYYSAFRAIDYAGGEQLIVRDSEFGMNGTKDDLTSAPIWVEGAGDPPGPGLVAEGLWMESSHGLAGIVLRGHVTHSIHDSWFAYTDATYAIDQEGGTLVCDNVRHDALNTVTEVRGGTC